MKKLTKSGKSSLEIYLGTIDKKNPLSFKMKNDFFYENAFMIIESNPLINNNSYLDVLQNLKSSRVLKRKTKFKSEFDIIKVQEETRSNKKRAKTIQTKSGSEPGKIKNESPKIPTLKLPSKNTVYPKLNLKTASNKEIQQVTSTIANSEMTTQETKAEKESEEKLNKPNGYNKSIDALRNFYREKMLIEKAKSAGIEVPSKNSTLKNQVKHSISKTSRTAYQNNSSTQNTPNCQVVRVKSKITDTPRENQFSLTKTIKDQSSSTDRKEQGADSDCRKIIQNLNKVRFKHFLDQQMKKGKIFDAKLIRSYVSKYADKFIVDKETYNYVLKTENLRSDEHKDELIDRLETLDKLQNILPNFRDYISHLKTSNSKLEKRKIATEYQVEEITERIDRILSDDKLSNNFSINFKDLGYSTMRNIRPRNDKLGSVNVIPKDGSKKKVNTYLLKENKVKPKYKSYGKSKIMIVPKLLKDDVEICENEDVIKIPKIKNQVKEILDTKTRNLRDKKFLDYLSSPKTVNGHLFKYNSDVCDKIFDKCNKLELKNLRLMNGVKVIKKKYTSGNMYVSPKSAFKVPQSDNFKPK